MTKVVSLDFELCSTLNLREVGTDVWTRHASTIPIIAGYALDHDEPECIDFDALTAWMQPPPRQGAPPTGPVPLFLRDKLLDAIADGAEIHAWNANFEWNVWNHICVPRFGWPALPIERFHCTMCAAACAGLPMSLDEAAVAVGSPFLKNKTGQALMLRMARPRSDKPLRWWHREDPAKLKQLIAYNLDDVRAEREVHMRIPRMTRREREIWLVDQRMNARGLPVDDDLLGALHAITLQELLALNGQILTLTKGMVMGSTNHGKLLAWVQAGGYPHATLDKDTLFSFLGTPEFHALAPEVRDVLLTRAEAAKTSTAKLVSIAKHTSPDGYVRNLIQYGGATRTLRWAGKGPQIQNFPRPIVKHVDLAIREILAGADGSTIRHIFGRPLDVVSSCLRGVFKAPDGHQFVTADFNAIEAVVLAWLAKDEPLLDVFRDASKDIYIHTANSVGSSNRKFGKVLRLGLGYGMGHVKFLDTAAKNGITLTLAQAKDAVDAFRLANPKIVSLWHGVEATAKQAIMRPDDEFTYRKLRLRMASPKGRLAGSLLMELPSGRNLVYRNVRLEAGRIVFWGVHQITKQWTELDTYGGKLVENGTQAVARDLLADAIVNLDYVYPEALCTTIHDEVVAVTTDDQAPFLLTLMTDAMSVAPVWGQGLPLKAVGAITKRYGKL